VVVPAAVSTQTPDHARGDRPEWTEDSPSGQRALVALRARIERAYDALPRRAGVRVEAVGPFELFVREGPGWPFYARPRLGTVEVTIDDVEAVRARQRELGVPEAIEWTLELTPALAAAIPADMAARLAPLMVLDPSRLPDDTGAAQLLDPGAVDFADLYARSSAVAAVAFAMPGTAAGPQGTRERDALVEPVAPERLAALADELRSGARGEAVVVDPADGVVARGSYQSALGAAELVGVATLPSARRQGHGAAVSALLAHHARRHGNGLVFLSAADDAVARVYASIGFHRAGTAGIAEVHHGGAT
jgi:GNAT superfamily N-acetyltransferase